MVFLRPKVVRTPEDAQSLLRETEKTAPLVKQEMDKKPKTGAEGQSAKPGEGKNGEIERN
jgi:type II secretory pathway component GspD/PulD (secretin)